MARTLRIATFNLENLDDRAGATPTLAQRIAVLRPMLTRLEADVLCLQEVNAQAAGKDRPRHFRALDALLAETPYTAYDRVATVGRHGVGPSDVHNLVVLSRAPIRASRQIWHDLMSPPAYRPVTAEPRAAAAEPIGWDRPILAAEIDLGLDRPFHVVNLHLRAPLAAFVPGQKVGPFAWRSSAGWAEGFFLAAIKRAGQALEARLAVDRIFDADAEALLVLAGDCNAEARETALRLLAADTEDTGNGALAGRMLVPVERGVPEDRRYTVLHNGRRIMLDHLLVSRALMGAFRHVEIHNEALGDELVAYASVEASPESYHAPVVAEFTLPGD
jgi:endonuclease/exonuclease/phosphatase family metal-dependent hydrolase